MVDQPSPQFDTTTFEEAWRRFDCMPLLRRMWATFARSKLVADEWRGMSFDQLPEDQQREFVSMAGFRSQWEKRDKV